MFSKSKEPTSWEQQTSQSYDRRSLNFQKTCFYCSKKKKRDTKCRTKKREEVAQTQRDTQVATAGRLTFNQKTLRNNCGYTGHTERDCRHRKKTVIPHIETLPITNRTHKSAGFVRLSNELNNANSLPIHLSGRFTERDWRSRHLIC